MQDNAILFFLKYNVIQPTTKKDCKKITLHKKTNKENKFSIYI
jgi:hypothetical protein